MSQFEQRLALALGAKDLEIVKLQEEIAQLQEELARVQEKMNIEDDEGGEK